MFPITNEIGEVVALRDQFNWYEKLPLFGKRIVVTRDRRVELDLPGQLAQELVGYAVEDNSPYLRRGVIPSWAKPTLVIRDERVLTAAEAGRAQRGDYVYVLAPPEKARSLDRFFTEIDTASAAADR